ncbi:hypothetical protein [Kamptonema sp. UHCC 0994]|uniref:hypothetical protein n=1 Tax=Kamptonema sp. UHCC 0994 TaxID=3031329 RepID=UPI0023B999FA|nr:hypothetical protein [Kamptonema sp. UHCC 0994]MDF0553182.1 hypothetical protein [Kamptonema sp. UHCC 0994]
MLNRSFTLGFTCCLLLFLSVLCFLVEKGSGERGSGRIEFGTLIAEAQGQQKPDREPERGNGRRD